MYGPYTIVSHEGGETYIIKLDSTGQNHATSVPKSELKRA